MNKLFLITLAVFSIFLPSCSHNDEETLSIIHFQGNWTGSYSGTGDNGTWVATIDSSGTVTGTISSEAHSIIFPLEGSVSKQGAFDATVGTTAGGTTFKGQLNKTTGTGTWENDVAGINGTWTGNKQ